MSTSGYTVLGWVVWQLGRALRQEQDGREPGKLGAPASSWLVRDRRHRRRARRRRRVARPSPWSRRGGARTKRQRPSGCYAVARAPAEGVYYVPGADCVPRAAPSSRIASRAAAAGR